MKLAALTIKNFGCFDQDGCSIKIDNIVVLIGQNNIGKSTILDAYEAFASMGAEIPLKHFKDHNPVNIITIEGLFSEINDDDINVIGKACVFDDPEYGRAIKVKFEWAKPDEKGKKYTYNAEKDAYQLGGAGGWDTLLQSRIPAPLRIKPTDSPDEMEKVVTDILTSAIKQKVKTDNSIIDRLLNEVKILSEQFAQEMQHEIESACTSISGKLRSVFPNYNIEFVPEGKIEADKILGAGSHVRLSEGTRQAMPLKSQGAGLQRTFLWSAISALAEIGKLKQGKKALSADKPRILLIDEPEAFLHPQTIRAAREALYSLSELTNWQVIASTHSPVFIDVSKPHTTIIRIERADSHSVKVISTDKLSFDTDERTRLAMIRNCHPTINEFFFSDTVILVEGDTEQLVFTSLIKEFRPDKNYHVVNCLGKGNIPLFAKMLNHFELKYIAIHDSDSPKTRRSNTWVRNAAWTVNKNILDITLNSPKGSFCIAQVPDFEGYYFGERIHSDKPFTAYNIINSDEFKTSPTYERLRNFVEHIEDESHPNIYKDISELNNKVAEWVSIHQPTDIEMWEINN
jgi:putative ATP-dependent endonuclease of OLD family